MGRCPPINWPRFRAEDVPPPPPSLPPHPTAIKRNRVTGNRKRRLRIPDNLLFVATAVGADITVLQRGKHHQIADEHTETTERFIIDSDTTNDAWIEARTFFAQRPRQSRLPPRI